MYNKQSQRKGLQDYLRQGWSLGNQGHEMKMFFEIWVDFRKSG